MPAFFWAVLFFSFTFHYLSAQNLLVQTQFGNVHGFVNSVGVRVWKGIKYGQIASRWVDAVSPPTFPGIFEAISNAPGCPQDCGEPFGFGCPQQFSEDCLFLNIFSPNSTSQDAHGYPVIVFLHGGTFLSGAGTSEWYDGSHFALQNVVFVSINYRLGILGFLASASLSGNYGLKDQRLALQWVKNNIVSFGGDPNSVTLAGQSAGAASTLMHLTSQGSANLFQNAIVMSAFLGIPSRTRSSAETMAKKVFQYLNCVYDDISCLRQKSTAEILTAQSMTNGFDISNVFGTIVSWMPLVEPNGDFNDHTYSAISAGKVYGTAHTLLAGHTSDEAQIFVYGALSTPLSSFLYALLIMSTLPSVPVDKIMARYPCTTTDCRGVLSQMLSDRMFFCPQRKAFRSLTNIQTQASPAILTNIYRYIYKHNPTDSPQSYCLEYSCHGYDLPIVFGNFQVGSSSITHSASESTLSDLLRTAWVNLATNDNPDLGNPVPFSFSLNRTAILDYPTYSSQIDYRSDFCDFWDTYPYETVFPAVNSLPTKTPTRSPTGPPMKSTPPTRNPTTSPTAKPTPTPSFSPTKQPTLTPSIAPTRNPTTSPTAKPTPTPSFSPTKRPTLTPSIAPTRNPTTSPTAKPSYTPSSAPTKIPTRFPSRSPK